MNFKIDTKEKMHVIVVEEPILTVNMAEELTQLCKSFLEKSVKNVVLNLEKVNTVEAPLIASFVEMQQSFAEANVSLVFCCPSPAVKKLWQEEEVDDMLNWTPTESEAWDIVQMEEIEREYL